ncbi:LOW QUALITY PROTEIN: rho GTPase-activating protein 30-like [Betta splendens]|uniref:LOW QUALITY PROTEIN: rho GTPase-activating protein 30-like n=1 Tax=Betta splendens TaxID=158456 RepID=A0A9W2XDK8_BETSP|nr:LOW QUALITY PROTEIN: rho GTPase-activating protein 30-like [Betta splendens]
MRRVRRRGGNKEKVFGCDLLEHLTASSHEIPQVLQSCSSFVEQHGVVDGIYRLSGVSSNIQKLRGEFESDGAPELNKDLYLQDIHCVSSLCKAYFRELPNPLLTYQLYDKFAEAVSIQLEEERLVKIRDVLKELPRPHYRTLEFLMRHLVRMASHSSETNMHARNLAIVWAPNLLRSKDIEASGFNGTAAFMEVRVQSIVVEFILTHVPQLFPEQGASAERRNSLPSPSALSSSGEPVFKFVPSPSNFGNISPGDGPLAIRPYHAIIEGTDKRKGSLKGKKWMSIFNIGGRFPDPRKKHKHSAKEKERPPLRPARSMDSLSSPLYPKEGSRHPAQRPPSTSTSPLVTSSPKSGSEAAGSVGGIGVSEYAVTYRRGTGLVSGGAGTQGTYTALDPEGLGVAGSESVQTRSPGLSNKAGRRAAMHITGPTMVTVPLHITSNLALGVLQGGGGDRVIHRGRDKEGGDASEGGRTERKAEERRKPPRRKDRGGVVAVDGSTLAGEGGGGEDKEEPREEQEVTEACSQKPELVVRSTSSQREAQSPESSTNDPEDNDEYMVMKGAEAEAPPADDRASDASDALNATEAAGDDHELSGYVQDNFEFLDQMDCSALDHMDSSASYQTIEFSVEPPCHSDEEYELMSQQLAEHSGPEALAHSPNELNPHRPLSLDLQNRYTKSLSLPHMTSPVQGPEGGLCSEDEDLGDNSDEEEEDYSSEEDESMFYKSLPADLFLNDANFKLGVQTQESCRTDRAAGSSEDTEAETLQVEEAAATQQRVEEAGGEDGLEDEHITKEEEEEQGEEEGEEEKKKEEEEEGKEEKKKEEEEEKEKTKKEEEEQEEEEKKKEEQEEEEKKKEEKKKEEEEEEKKKEEEDAPDEGGDPPEQLEQSRTAEEFLSVVEDSPAPDASAALEFPPPPDDKVSAAEDPHSDCSAHFYEEDGGSLEPRDVQETNSDDEDRKDNREADAVSQVLEINENHQNICEEPSEEDNDVMTDRNHEEEKLEGDKQLEGATCGSSGEIWDELEDVICEVIEDEESEQAKRKGVSGQDGAGEEASEEKEEEKEQANETETERGAEADEKLSNPEFLENETHSSETGEVEDATQGSLDFSDEVQLEEEAASEEPEKESNDGEKSEEQPVPAASGSDPQEDRKCAEDIAPGGVGRKLVVSKSPKVCLVKAVPVVPPKPQHCKITALSLRQQQQQLRVPAEQDKAGDKERDRRRDGDDANRNSPLSMCFDEAVAIATMRRGKEKVREGEAEGLGKRSAVRSFLYKLFFYTLYKKLCHLLIRESFSNSSQQGYLF